MQTNAAPGERSASESDAKRDRESGLSVPTVHAQPYQSGLGIGPRGAPDAAALAAAPAPAGLPCQNSNNSNRTTKRYRLKRVQGSSDFFTSRDCPNAVWRQLDEDTLSRWGMPSGAEAKAAFHLRLNVAAFVSYWGRNHCLFFTITDEANEHPAQFARRWNSFRVRGGSWILSYIRVLEPQKSGRPHYHLLVAVAWDTRPDAFDWEAFDLCQRERRERGTTPHFRELRRRYKESAAPELVLLWSLLRKALPRYGLGRAELLPLRKGKEAISEYVGKYLEAGLTFRKHSWKGCRRVEFDRRAKVEWLSCTRVFAWHSAGAQAWRKRVGELGRSLGVSDMVGISRKLGRRWAYRLKEVITLGEEEEWQSLLTYLRAGLAAAISPSLVLQLESILGSLLNQGQ